VRVEQTGVADRSSSYQMAGNRGTSWKAPEGAVRCLLTVGGLAPETGGPASALPALCDALARLGAEVELVSLDLGARFERPLVVNPSGWRLTLVRALVWRRLRLTWAPAFGRAVSDACRRLGNPVVHDNGVWLPSNHAVVRVAHHLGAPLVVSPRGMLMPWSRRTKAAKKALASWLYQRHDLQSVSLFHATSDQELEALRALGLRQPVAVVPNIVQLPPADLGPHRAGPVRVVLFLSRLSPKKGLDSLLRAWRALEPQGWKLVIAGPDEGDYGARLRKEWPVGGRGPAVEFVGPVWGAEKWRLFRQAGVLVLPSLSENFGLVVAEALASGVPVITTKETPWRAIDQHRCGWWIDVGDAPLAAALRMAIALSDEERSQMGARGRALIGQEYSAHSVAARMMGVYAWLLHKGPRPEWVVVG
jgi:glycosyltransferase involved in cell wall biosynthesis